MTATNELSPPEALRYLKDKGLPLIVSFHLEEEKGHIITGKGLCYVEEVYGSSRVKLGRFSPFRSMHAARSSGNFYATFEIGSNTYGCVIENITADRSFLVADIPARMSPFLRKFLRVEPSKKAPVLLHLMTEIQGTTAYYVRDISERGIGFIAPMPPGVPNKTICGIYMPLDGGTIILSTGVIVYTREVSERKGPGIRPSHSGGTHGISFGIQLFPHPEDEKKIRLYVMQRELEIRKKIQEQL